MFALYKKELQSYFLSPIAYFVIAFFMATFSLTFIQDIGNVSSSTYTFSFPSIFYVNIFYFIFLLPLLTMRTFSEERKNGTETLLLSSPLNVTQIVMAKFLATATILLMMLVVSLFYPILTSIYGRVIWSSLICTYIGFFLSRIVSLLYCASFPSDTLSGIRLFHIDLPIFNSLNTALSFAHALEYSSL